MDEKFHIFHVMVNSGPEVDARPALLSFHEPLVSGSHCVYKRQLRRLLDEFHSFNVKVDSSRGRFSRRGSHIEFGHYSHELPEDV